MITPNRLSWFRVAIALVCPFILLSQRHVWGDIICMFLFAVASITDWLDGYLARKYSMVSWIGKVLDPIADKILILGTMISFCLLGLYSFWWILLIIIREISVTGTRFYCLKKGIVIPAEWAGKVKLGVQIVSISFTFFWLTAQDVSLTGFPLTVFAVLHWAGIVLANYFTVSSGIIFFKHLKLKP